MFLEHHDGQIQKGSLGVLSKAASLGDAAGIVLGEGARDATAEAGAHGAATVYVADAPARRSPVSASRRRAREGRPRRRIRRDLPRPVGAGGRHRRRARGSARRGPQLGSRRRARGRRQPRRRPPALGDSVYVDTGWRSTPAIALFRAGSFDPVPAAGAGEVVDVSAEFESFSTLATLTGHDTEEQAGPSIEEADIIVAGGRGLGGPEGFAQLEGSRRRSAVRSPPRAPSSMRAGTRTRHRSARRGRRWRPSSTSQPVFPARSSTRWACRAQARSSRSTRIRTRRSSSSATSAPIVGDLNVIVPKLTELVRARKSLGGRRQACRLPTAGSRRPRRSSSQPIGNSPKSGSRSRCSSSAPGRPGWRPRSGWATSSKKSPGARRAARQGAGRGARQGCEAGCAPALGRGREPHFAARTFAALRTTADMPFFDRVEHDPSTS